MFLCWSLSDMQSHTSKLNQTLLFFYNVNGSENVYQTNLFHSQKLPIEVPGRDRKVALSYRRSPSIHCLLSSPFNLQFVCTVSVQTPLLRPYMLQFNYPISVWIHQRDQICKNWKAITSFLILLDSINISQGRKNIDHFA